MLQKVEWRAAQAGWGGNRPACESERGCCQNDLRDLVWTRLTSLFSPNGEAVELTWMELEIGVV